ncbi:phosphoribosylglycinamide formyltransferase [Paenibacillus sp. y28]|uniref:phosphoribosylglycinamide formyltransferase n=1 Tax=Paenibacillus sp. y28 TaxID=3129110 RepID=UPI00301AFF95
MRSMNMGFLVSHGGSNMQAVVDACKQGTLNASPRVVISNNSGSMALQRARREGIPGYHLSAARFPDPVLLDEQIYSTLRRHDVDLVLLAGYMKRLGEQTMSGYEGSIMNIHPSLLPKFGGAGMYGGKVHEAVVAAGETVTGVTIHRVSGEYDTGEILAQCEVPVYPGDTADALGERVLKREHEFLVETLIAISEGRMG